MTTLASLTVTRILLITAGWLVFVFLLHGVGLFVAIRQLQARDGRGGLAAVGFDIRRLLLELFVPPLALAIVWVVARVLSTRAP